MMTHKLKHLLSILVFLPLAATAASVKTPSVATSPHPFYAGVTGGYGSTTWQGLVPSVDNQNNAMIVSTPVNAEEGGAVWGLYAGYEFIPNFAMEASYMRYPTATVTFDADSLFAFDNDGQTSLQTHTETASLMGKIMLGIPRTIIKIYSSAGAAVTHRWDQLNDSRRVTPTFGVGINWDFSPHIMGEVGGNYTAGFGQSELNPADDYMPFLYAVFMRVAYRF